MKSRRRLNRAHQRGFRDGADGQPKNPFQYDKYERWAYKAGHAEGRREWDNRLDRIKRALENDAR